MSNTYLVNQAVNFGSPISYTISSGEKRSKFIVKLRGDQFRSRVFHYNQWVVNPGWANFTIHYRFGSDSWKLGLTSVLRTFSDSYATFEVALAGADRENVGNLQILITKTTSDINMVDEANLFTFYEIEEFTYDQIEDLITVTDRLESEDTVEMLLGVSEGEISGLENGEKSLYVGDTPLVSAGGSPNFTDYNLQTTLGKATDEPLKMGLGGVARSVTVNTPLLQNVAVTRSTMVGRRNFLELRMLVNSLFKQVGGSIQGNVVEFEIYFKKSTAVNFTKLGDCSITGRTTSSYVREFRWAVDSSFFGSYDVRVIKKSEDPDGTTEAKNITWESIQETGDQTVKHNNTALTKLLIKASGQFSSLQDVSGIYKLLKVKIPTNYDPIIKSYVGEWDGTFKVDWTDNPAWCVYDIIDNDRYGLNAHYQVTADKWDFYEAAQWCDEQVSDGEGGFQARHTMNYVITDENNGREIIDYLCGAFNSRLIEYADGNLGIRVDKDETPVAIFTPETISAEGFSYSYSDPATQYNDIEISHVDPLLNWEVNRYRVYDQEDINRVGRVPNSFVAVGVLNRQEALRHGYYKLITGLTEVETVSFKTNRMAHILEPYNVILVSDPNMGYGFSERVKSLNTTRDTITLRKSFYLEAGVDYEVQFRYKGELLTRNIINQTTGLTTIFQLNEALPEDIQDFAAFTIGSSSLSGAPKPYRVMEVKESQGEADSYVVTAIEINRNKWQAVDNLEMASAVEYSRLPTPWVVPHADNVSFQSFYNRDSGIFTTTMSVILNKSKYPWYNNQYEIWFRQGTGGWTSVASVEQLPEGSYEFKVLPFNHFGQKAVFETAPIWSHVVPSPLGPEDVLGFNIRIVDESSAILSWARNEDPNVPGYQIRYTANLEETRWGNMNIMFEQVTGTAVLVPPRSGVYAIKAINRWGLSSLNASFIVTDIENILSLNVIETIEEDPDWLGEKTNTVKVGDRLELDSVDTMADWEDLSSVLTLRYGSSGLSATGIYYANQEIDIGEVSECRILSTIIAEGKNVANFMSTWQKLSDVENLAGVAPANWAVQTEFAFRNSPSDDWSAWRELTYTRIAARQFKFRILLFSNDPTTTPSIKNWKVEIDMAERTVAGEDIIIPVEGKRVSFTPPFTALKGVGFASQGLQSGDYYVINNKDETGFDIQYFDSTDTAIPGLLDYVAVGYGRKIL